MSSLDRPFTFPPQLEVVEDRRVPAAFAGISADAISPDNGGTLGKISSGEDIAEIEAYFRGGVRTALGDGVRDLITGTGGSGGPQTGIPFARVFKPEQNRHAVIHQSRTLYFPRFLPCPNNFVPACV